MRSWGSHCRRTAGAAAALLAVVQVSPAQASTSPVIAYYSGGTPNHVDIPIDVTASVGGRCGFATGQAPNDSSVNAGAIDTDAWSKQIPFVAECTAPWRIAVSSLNGALLTSGSTTTGYINKAPYTVALHVNYDNGTAGSVDSSCGVDTIDQASSSATCNFKGTASTSNGLLIPRSFGLSGSYVQVSAPAYSSPTTTLISGTYVDTLTVTVSPAT